MECFDHLSRKKTNDARSPMDDALIPNEEWVLSDPLSQPTNTYA